LTSMAEEENGNDVAGALTTTEQGSVDMEPVQGDDKVQLIEVKNLIVSPAPMRRIRLGTVESMLAAVSDPRNEVKAVVWNERRIHLVTGNGMDISFKPIFDRSTTVFFNPREERLRAGWGDPDDGKLVWEGEYEPVLFSKTSLLRYLKQYSDCFDERIQQAVRELKVRASASSKEIMLDDVGEASRTVEEVTSTSNIPREFSASLPLFDGIRVEVVFEASIKKKDKKTLIELQCTNAKEVMRQAMEGVLARLPEGLPAYYGDMRVEAGNEKKGGW